MKRFIVVFLVLLFPVSAFADDPVPAGYPPAMSRTTALPDYLGQNTIPLTRGEQRALRLSRDWTGRGPAPVLSFSGKLIYVHGASMPTILAAPMQVCDVELQQGEKVHEIVVGDSARWMVETGATGSGLLAKQNSPLWP